MTYINPNFQVKSYSIEDKRAAEWVAYLFERLIESGIDEDAHWRVPESFVSDFSKEEIYVNKPSNDSLKKVNIELVMQYLSPVLKEKLLKVVKDFENKQ